MRPPGFDAVISLGASDYTVRWSAPETFARLLGKIALGYVVEAEGYDSIATELIAPAILGVTNDIGRWVGSPAETKHNPNTGFHSVAMMRSSDGFHVFVRLFAQFNVPEYLVVIPESVKFRASLAVPSNEGCNRQPIY